MPFQAADFACSQPMAIGDQDHRGIAMTTAAHLAGCVHQSLDLALGEVATCNCEVLVLGVLALARCFAMRKAPRIDMTVSIMALFFTVQLGIYLLSHKEVEKSLQFFSRIFSFSFFCFENRVRCKPVGPRRGEGRMGVGVFARLQHTPGIANGTRELRTGSRCVPQYGTRIRNWGPLFRR